MIPKAHAPSAFGPLVVLVRGPGEWAWPHPVVRPATALLGPRKDRAPVTQATQAVLESWRKAYASEHVQFGIDEGAIEGFPSRRGFRRIENLTPQEIEGRFLRLKDGSLAGRVVAVFNLAHASIVA